MTTTEVQIEPWTDADLALLRRVNTPEMKKHVGGPETEEQLLVRHGRYLDFVPSGPGCMYRIVLLPEGSAVGTVVGTVGYGTRTWAGETVHEMGWNVLPEHQGRGIAVAATRAAVAAARREAAHRFLHAFPSVDNPASSAVCAKAGSPCSARPSSSSRPGSSCAATTGGWTFRVEALRG